MMLGFFDGIGGVIASAAADRVRFRRSLYVLLRTAAVAGGGLGGFNSFFRCLYRLLASAVFRPRRLFTLASVGTTSLHHISLLV